LRIKVTRKGKKERKKKKGGECGKRKDKIT